MPAMSQLAGTPSDDVPEILATGRSDITTVFLSMTARHPEGRDDGYIEWHCLDHQPELKRLPSMRTSIRLVSTPACRAARAASEAPYDGVDHVMAYLMASDTDAALEEFRVLNHTLLEVGRTPYLLPMIQRAVYRFDGMVAAPRIKVGADVLPWWPPRGVYVLLERGAVSPADLTSVPGVAGAWWATGIPKGMPFSTVPTTRGCGSRSAISTTSPPPRENASVLRWRNGGPTAGAAPLLAAPSTRSCPHEWDRYCPDRLRRQRCGSGAEAIQHLVPRQPVGERRSPGRSRAVAHGVADHAGPLALGREERVPARLGGEHFLRAGLGVQDDPAVGDRLQHALRADHDQRSASRSRAPPSCCRSPS